MIGLPVLKPATLGLLLATPVAADPVAICMAWTMDMTALDEPTLVNEASLFLAEDGSVSRSYTNLVDPIWGEQETWNDPTIFDMAAGQLPAALNGAPHVPGDCEPLRLVRINSVVVNADGSAFRLDTDCPSDDLMGFFNELNDLLGGPASNHDFRLISAPLGVSLCEGVINGA